jgi:hypothetical protein
MFTLLDGFVEKGFRRRRDLRAGGATPANQ